METIGELRYGPFKTVMKASNDVKEFFLSSGDKDLKKILLENMNSDEWYQGWLLKYLDINKDGVPDEEFGKNFVLMYCGIIQNPEDYMDLDYLIEDLELDHDKVIFDGSRQVAETLSPDDEAIFWIRFVLLKI